jgi:hypothetical protein
MDLELRRSGLVVPKHKRKPPERRYGQMEIQDDERRAIAAEGLSKLWDAMDLSRGVGGIRLPGKPSVEVSEAYYQVYRFVGEMLLGKDCPKKEVLT